MVFERLPQGMFVFFELYLQTLLLRRELNNCNLMNLEVRNVIKWIWSPGGTSLITRILILF